LARDYLLESEPGAEQAHLKELEEVRERMHKSLEVYSQSLSRGESEAQPFHDLETEISDYWNLLDPVLKWTPEERKAQRDVFLRKKLMPRRAAVLRLAAKISAVNEKELAQGDRKLEAVYQGHRRRLLRIGTATVILGVVVAFLVAWEILWLEREERRRYGELQRAQTDMKRLSAKLVKVQEEERRAISRELHDEVGQSLAALLMEVGNMGASPPAERGTFQAHVESIKKLAETSVKAVRNMALLLRPSMLDDLGLVPALEWQAREVAKRTGIEVEVNAGDAAEQLPDEQKTCIYRVVQEALNNCARHAGAHLVHIDLERKAAGVALTVRDDGKGFDPSRTRGMGLLGMEERVKDLGGSFRVESGAGHGTLLRIDLPLNPC